MHIIKKTRDEQNNYHSYNDEPAIIKSYGDKFWYCHGKLHRDNGPAIEYNNGDKYWHIHGKLHREDGPAIIRSNGDKFWYIHGKEYTFHEWVKLSPLSEDHKVELLLSHD